MTAQLSEPAGKRKGNKKTPITIIAPRTKHPNSILRYWISPCYKVFLMHQLQKGKVEKSWGCRTKGSCGVAVSVFTNSSVVDVQFFTQQQLVDSSSLSYRSKYSKNASGKHLNTGLKKPPDLWCVQMKWTVLQKEVFSKKMKF